MTRAALGIGFSSTAGAEAMISAMRQALDRAGVGEATLHASERKSRSDSLRRAAASLGMILVFHDEAALRQRASDVASHSARVEALAGVGSLAEAAALVGAGAGSRLILPKFSADGVSCAVAVGAEDRS